ncbi:hypothetical protein D3C73_1656530 [compost metagenome]
MDDIKIHHSGKRIRNATMAANPHMVRVSGTDLEFLGIIGYRSLIVYAFGCRHTEPAEYSHHQE